MNEDAELDLDFDSSLDTAEEVLREDIETIDSMQNEGDQSTFLCSLDIIKSHISNTIERERKLLINIKTLKDHYFVSEIKKMRYKKLYAQTMHPIPHKKQSSSQYRIFANKELNILSQELTSNTCNLKQNKKQLKAGIFPISYNLVSIPPHSYDIIHIQDCLIEAIEKKFASLNVENADLIADKYQDNNADSYRKENSKDHMASMHLPEESNFPVHTIASNVNHLDGNEKVVQELSGEEGEGVAQHIEDSSLLEEQDVMIESEQNIGKNKMYSTSKYQAPNNQMDRLIFKPKTSPQNTLYKHQEKAQSLLASQEMDFKMSHTQDDINSEAYNKIDSRAESLVNSALPYLHFSIDDNLLNNDELDEFSNIIIQKSQAMRLLKIIKGQRLHYQRLLLHHSMMIFQK